MNASAALSRAVQYGYDDCLSPHASEKMTSVLKNPTAMQALASMKITEIPQAQMPTRETTSAGVLSWRAQLLLIQRAQREYVKKSDEQRMVHAATMGVIGGSSSAAAMESARRARAIAESRRAEILKRAFVRVTPSSNQPRSCAEWAAGSR